MSFTTEIKNEICMLNYSNPENISELSGFARNNRIKDFKKFILTTENPKVARRIYSLLKSIYDIVPVIEQKKGANFSKKSFYLVNVNEKEKTILKDLMLINENDKKLKNPSEYLIDSEELKRAYLRGAFLAKGSVNDPKTSRYHLEYLIDEKDEAKFISNILDSFDLKSKIIPRDMGFMVYVKEAEKIGDFLRIISADRAVLYYEDIRIYRDHKNMTNRLNNCEQANIDKIILSSEKQINDFNYIIEKVGLDALDGKLQETIKYRKKYPEVSLNDLSHIISTETGIKITKSGLNHRFRKLNELKERIEKND